LFHRATRTKHCSEKPNHFNHAYRPLAQFYRSLDYPQRNEPKPGARRLPESACNLVGCCALGLTLNGDNVVGSRSIDVGNKGPAKKPGGPTVDRLSEAVRFPELRIDGGDPPKAKVCGAMSQQYGDGDHGNVSAPQKFVQLVGCRDPNARTGPQTGVGARPRPAPSKR
jgi:hypothetical protein